MTFDDIKKDKYHKENLGLAINRIRYINVCQPDDDIMKEFIRLLDLGGFTITLKGSVIEEAPFEPVTFTNEEKRDFFS